MFWLPLFTTMQARADDEFPLEPQRKWAAELGSGVTFANVRDSNLQSYTLVPLQLTLSRRFSHPCLEDTFGGIFRATPEFLVKADWTVVEDGVESHLGEFGLGVRYNFGQPGGRWAPFVETTVGAAWADAHPYEVNGQQYGLGENFNFTFAAATGIRYDLTERSYLRLSLAYAHYSNAGLSEPAHENKAIDALGPLLSFGFRF